jgi:hypothetical protein
VPDDQQIINDEKVGERIEQVIADDQIMEEQQEEMLVTDFNLDDQ